tara:strand:+ start:629 stop:1618 length:990 start_codon:yes stop_codon:yes gene_type:complete
MKVVFFQRKPRPNKNFSLEILFDQIRSNLPKDISPIIEISSYYSNGFFKRIYILIEAIYRQGDVNHVTGDINFTAILLKKKKTILTIHDLGCMNHPNPIARKILQIIWLQLPVKRAGYVTTVSQATKNELLKFVNVDENKIRVLYIPVAKLITYSPKEFNTTTPVILQVGTKENKNLLRLIEAIQDIKCKLEIIGVLDERQLLALKKYKINYNNAVNISNKELKEKYEKADLLAFISTYEGFGMPIVEAQIVGRPVITSNLLSMPEVAADGAHVIDPYNIAEIKDGIQKIINDQGYRNDLIAKGRKNALRFSPSIIANQYAELYREIVS